MGGLGSGLPPDEARRREATRLRDEGLSLQEIGRRLGVTRQRVEQIFRAVERARARCLTCRACGGMASPPGSAPADVRIVLCLTCLAQRPDAPFAERLRTCRAAAGLTVRELARRAGLSTEKLRYYETGAREPRWGPLASMVRVLGPALVAVTPCQSH